MPKTIERLQEDHRRLANILSATAQIVNAYSREQTTDTSDHLFCLIEYLSGYPDDVHHPVEDLVFGRMLELDISAEEFEKVKHNQSQHSQLQAATSTLRKQFNLVTDQRTAEQFVSEIEQYSNQQLKHMNFEEQEIFPLALKKMPAALWDELDEHFGKSQDPLFDQADQKYAALYRYLVIDSESPDAFSDGLLRFLSATKFG